jgi:hypothetical protein
MFFCDQVLVEKWSPDFSSSGLSNPVWTRVRYGQTVLCNSLEDAAWDSNPVQVELCDTCGTVGCSSCGYVHVSVFGDIVLWTLPSDVPGVDPTLAGFPATCIEKFGSVAFPSDTWESFRAAASEVPRLRNLSRANGRALRDAWAVGQTRPRSVERLVPLLRACLLAADTLEVSEAIQWIEHWLHWFHEREGTEIDGALWSAKDSAVRTEKLYFDGPGTADWVALACVGGSMVPALGPDHIFIPTE